MVWQLILGGVIAAVIAWMFLLPRRAAKFRVKQKGDIMSHGRGLK